MSEADALELAAEMEECDETNAVEEDEEEVDLDASIAACLDVVVSDIDYVNLLFYNFEE